MSDASLERSSQRTPTTPAIPPTVRFPAMIAALIIGLILAATWLVALELRLPDIRTPRDPGASSVLPGHGLMTPGLQNIHIVDTNLTGDWVSQEIGESDWLATDVEGSRLRAAFYGTDLYLLARVGPDSSRAYVAVNQQPVDHLANDELGSYVSLWAGQASDQPILLASNLAHGEHLVEVIAGGDGELAIAGFDVRAATPLPWAFTLAYAGLAGGLFVVLRSLLYLVNRESSAVLRNLSGDSSEPRR